MFRLTVLVVVSVSMGHVSAAPLSPSYAEAVLADEPLGYWRLGETSGPTALDAVSPGQDGTYVGGVLLGQAGALLTDSDTAVEVTGRTTYVDIGVHEAINQLDNDFTVEAWVRPNGTGGGQSFLSNRTYWEGAGGIRLGMDGSRLLFTAFGPKDYLSDPGVISAGQWYHVAAVFDADNDVSFFLNGSFVQTVTGSSPANPSVKPLTFGRNPISYGSQAFYSGGLDEVAIYDRSLSAGEIQEHYLAATVPEPSTLILLATGALGLLACGWRRRRGKRVFRLTSCLVVLILVCGGGVQLSAANITFSDGTFDDSDWAVIHVTSGNGGAVSGSQSTSGGNPNEYRRVINHVNLAPGGGARSEVFGFHKRIAAIYDPAAQGPIASIDFSIDYKSIATTNRGHAFGFALEQADSLFGTVERASGTVPFWAPAELTALEETDFGRVTVYPTGEIVPDFTENPDFSAAGSAIEFGFYAYNSTRGDAYSQTVGYDNWSTTIHAIPEPSTLVLLATSVLGLLACGWRRRQRKGMFRLTSCLVVLVVLAGVDQIRAASSGTGIMLFDEPTDCIDISGQTVIGTAATYEAWVKFTDAYSGRGYVFIEGLRAVEDKHLTVGPTNIKGHSHPVNAGLGLTVDTIVALDDWHHVAYVYDGSQERLYLDGIRVGFLPTATIDVADSAESLATVGGTGFVGYLDSLRISNTARYDGVTFVPPQGDLASDANALLLYNFNDTPGSMVVLDESPLGRTGSLGEGRPGATLPTLVPEPSTLILLATSVLGLLACGWRRRQRKGMSRLTSCLALLLVATVCSATRADVLTYFSENSVALYDFDTITRTSMLRTYVEPLIDRDALFSLDTRPSDEEVFGVLGFGGPGDGLYTIDPNTGNTTFIGAPGADHYYTDITFQRTSGTLYGGVFRTPGESRHLVEIDTADGSFLEIGELPFTGTGALALASNDMGELYALFKPSHSNVTTLYSIDPTNASAAAIGTSTAFYGGQGAVFLDGRLFVTDYAQLSDPLANLGTMFEVDTSNGVATEVGTLSGGQIGGVFVGDPLPGSAVTFQQGVAGYHGTVDTFLQENSPSVDNSLAAELNVDDSDPGTSGRDSQILLRFDDVFGDGPGQIPTRPGVTIRWAQLELMTTNAGDGATLHRMLQPFSDSDTWDLLGDGVQADGVEALSTADLLAGENGGVPLNVSSFDVTASLQAWHAAPETNHGWAFLPVGDDGWDFYSAEGATPPRLIVNYVPEPGTLAMLLGGLAGLSAYGWRRRRRG